MAEHACHIASAFRKQRGNRKWAGYETSKAVGSDALPPAKLYFGKVL